MTCKTQTLMETMVSSEFALFGPNLWSSTFQSFSQTIHPLYSIKWGISNAKSLETMVSREFALIQKRKLAGNPATKPQNLWKPWFWAVLDEFAERKVCWKPSNIWGTMRKTLEKHDIFILGRYLGTTGCHDGTQNFLKIKFDTSALKWRVARVFGTARTEITSKNKRTPHKVSGLYHLIISL